MGMRMQQQDQFDVARKRAQQEANAAKQTQSDALKRRFAAQGMMGSGAAIKQERLANEGVDKQLSDRNESIDAAQQQEFGRKQEIEDQRNFARQERLGSQDFAKGESAMARALQERQFGETIGMQKQQFGDSMAFQKQQFGDTMGFQRERAKADDLFKTKSFDESKSQFGQQFGLAQKQFMQDREMTAFNARIAAKEAGVSWAGFAGDDPNLSMESVNKKINEEAQRSAIADANAREQQKVAAARAQSGMYTRTGTGNRGR